MKASVRHANRLYITTNRTRVKDHKMPDSLNTRNYSQLTLYFVK
jgi:hypothetical protein